MIRSLTIIVLALLAGQAYGAAPVDWTADPATWAWYPFDNDYLNHSTSTTYCNPITDGDMIVGTNPGDISLTTDAMQGTHSYANAGFGQLHGRSLTGAHDCMRGASPDVWTITSWFKSNTNYGTNYYPQIIGDQSNTGFSSTYVAGWNIQVSPKSTGMLAICAGDPTKTNAPECAANTWVGLGSAIPPDSQWHFVTAEYTGAGGHFALGKDGVVTAVGPTFPSFEKNCTDPSRCIAFEMPHEPGTYDNLHGAQDATWFVGVVLTATQVCRARAVHPTGELGWCNGPAWNDCNTDADCNNIVGSCNTSFPHGGKAGQCVGLLSSSGPTNCNTVADLGACDAVLTAAPPTTTSTVTTTSSVTTTSATTTTLHYDAPKGPPAAYNGDPIPAPALRTLWVDRCGRGNAGVCGSVTCSNAVTCGLTKNTPCCTLKSIQLITGGLRPGDQINVRAGTSAADGYWEVDDGNGKWAVATMSPTVKGTALCAGGTHVNWGCSTQADCPGSFCDYRPIVMKAYVEADGSIPHIDPSGHGVQATGGTFCNGGTAGRYIGINFGNPACASVSNDTLMCYGGTTEGKPCASIADCSGAVACASVPWYWIIDGFAVTNWSDYDTNLTHDTTNNYCSMEAFTIGNRHGCTATEHDVGITVQNMEFHHDNGAAVLLGQGASGLRWFHNYVHDNLTHGFSSPVDSFIPRDDATGRTSYIWGNTIHSAMDICAPWAPSTMCLPSGAPPSLTCTGGVLDGTACTSEAMCGSDSHCGPFCKWDAFHNTAPGQQGYTCQCATNNDCVTGLTCQTQNAAHNDCANGDTEGKCIIIDTGQTHSLVDIRNNIGADCDGDCIAVFRSDNVLVANNTCYHNAKKGGGAYNEISIVGNAATVGNNIMVPLPNGSTCDQGTAGGQACATPLTVSCAGGAWCQAPGFIQFDTFGTYPITRATISVRNDDMFFNKATFITDPPNYQYSGGLRGHLSDYKAYGVTFGLFRGTNSMAVDPQFVSTTMGDPGVTNFLHISAGSPIIGSGLQALAPPFDINGNVRPNPPTIGALEPDSVTTTTVSTTTSTTLVIPPPGSPLSGGVVLKGVALK